MQVVDGYAPFLCVVVPRPLVLEPHDATAHVGVEEANPYRRHESLAVGLDGVEALHDLDQVLKGLEEAATADVDAKSAGAGEGFDDSPCGHAADEGGEQKLDAVRRDLIEDIGLCCV